MQVDAQQAILPKKENLDRRTLPTEAIGIGSDGINAAKGLFILFIIIGHNPVFNSQFADLNRFLYYFHVHVFFLLSALLPTRAWSLDWCRDRLIRYGVPFLAFTTFSWLIYGIVFLKEGPRWIPDSIGGFLKAILIGSGDALKDATGFKFFWFIPAFIVFVNLRALMLRSGFFKYGILLLSLVPLLYGYQLPKWLEQGNPWGIYIALWIVPFAVLVPSLIPFLEKFKFRNRLLAFGFLFFFFQGLVYLLNLHRLALSGLSVPPIWQPEWFWTTFLLVPAAFYFFLHLSELLRESRLLKFAGKYSLLIYLLHSFVQIPACQLLGKYFRGSLPESVANIGTVVTSCLMTILVCLTVALILERSNRIMNLLFPKDWSQWIQALALGKPKES